MPKKGTDNNDGIEKKQKNSEIIDENEINEIEEKPLDYTYDIILIQKILGKNYINHFHYQNIKECYNYMKKKYESNK